MKRIIFLLLMTALLLTGCREKTPEQTTSTATAEPETAAAMVSMYDLRTAMLAKDEALPEMMSVSSVDENASELFGYLSDVDYTKVEGYYLSYAADGTAYEIAVVALRDEADLPLMEKSLKSHVENRVTLYKNYAPAEMEKAQNARIVTCGRYAALIMCQNQDAVQQAFEAGVK